MPLPTTYYYVQLIIVVQIFSHSYRLQLAQHLQRGNNSRSTINYVYIPGFGIQSCATTNHSIKGFRSEEISYKVSLAAEKKKYQWKRSRVGGYRTGLPGGQSMHNMVLPSSENPATIFSNAKVLVVGAHHDLHFGQNVWVQWPLCESSSLSS